VSAALLAVVALALATGACTRRPAPAADTAAGAPPTDSAPPPAGGPSAGQDAGAGRAAVVSLEREARALAKAEGCEQAAQCRTAPVGSRPCGGPREYLVYCALTTDSAALFRKLAELERAEKAYNERAGLMSTCEFRMPPTAELAGRVCQAGGRAP
jgi:hypothetical protein